MVLSCVVVVGIWDAVVVADTSAPQCQLHTLIRADVHTLHTDVG